MKFKSKNNSFMIRFNKPRIIWQIAIKVSKCLFNFHTYLRVHRSPEHSLQRSLVPYSQLFSL